MKNTKFEYRISIKSKNGAYPTILNHTPRTANVFINGYLSKNVPSLDTLLNEYIDKRKTKYIGEDISLCKLECVKDNLQIKECLKEVISYFIFDGSGKGDSKCKSNSLLFYKNNTIKFIKCCNLEEKKKYVETILNNCIISLRDKGMPKKIKAENKPWIFNDYKTDGSIKYKGSLHIRLK